MTQKTNERFFMFVETGSVVTLSQLVQLKRTYDVKPGELIEVFPAVEHPAPTIASDWVSAAE